MEWVRELIISVFLLFAVVMACGIMITIYLVIMLIIDTIRKSK